MLSGNGEHEERSDNGGTASLWWRRRISRGCASPATCTLALTVTRVAACQLSETLIEPSFHIQANARRAYGKQVDGGRRDLIERTYGEVSHRVSSVHTVTSRWNLSLPSMHSLFLIVNFYTKASKHTIHLEQKVANQAIHLILHCLSWKVHSQTWCGTIPFVISFFSYSSSPSNMDSFFEISAFRIDRPFKCTNELMCAARRKWTERDTGDRFYVHGYK